MNIYYAKALENFQAIAGRHERIQDDHLLLSTANDEKQVLELLYQATDAGFVDAYVMIALLESANNWSNLIIVRPMEFQILLRRGVTKGCLGPDGHEEAWEWMRIAAMNNDPTFFLDDDMEEYYDILMTAVEHGNDIARNIMDTIWEPENIMEED